MQTPIRLLLVDDDDLIAELVRQQVLEHSHIEFQRAPDAAGALLILSSRPIDVLLLDIQLPRMDGFEILRQVRVQYPLLQTIMFTNQGQIQTAVRAMKEGAFDFIQKPHEADELINAVERAANVRKLIADKKYMKEEIDRLSGSTMVIAESEAMRDVMRMVEKVVGTDASVFLNGESGTGKEIIARQIHNKSNRKNEPFVAINCASIPDQLLESELFGHEKGSFTGAHATKEGLVEAAHNGTLFLDEVGDISIAIQPKLLRFLETKEFRRVGGTSTLKADVRIVSATNRELEEQVKLGKFREDLFYRLNVFNIHLPPLRERREDILLFAESFVGAKKKDRTLSPDTRQLLMRYDWPGNVRELRHAIESALLLADKDEIRPEDFRMNAGLMALIDGGQLTLTFQNTGGGSAADWKPRSLEELEREHIQRILRHTQFNRGKSAKLLGITEKTLYSKIKKYNIKTPRK